MMKLFILLTLKLLTILLKFIYLNKMKNDNPKISGSKQRVYSRFTFELKLY